MPSHLYSFGSNGKYQLGLGHDQDTHIPNPVESDVLPPVPPKALAAGGNHTILVYPDGNAYSVGDNECGQSGLGEDSVTVPHFTKVKGSWSAAAAGWEFSIFVSASGTEVYSAGRGTRGELGLGTDALLTGRRRALQHIPDFPPPGRTVTEVAAGVAHVICTLDDDSVWAWGDGRKGQLEGAYEKTKVWWTPRDTGLKAIPRNFYNVEKRVACGREFTLIQTEDGPMLLGGGPRDRWQIASIPSYIPATVKNVGACWSSGHVVSSDGRVISWGRNDRGQGAPDCLPSIKLIASGSEHVLAQDYQGNIYAWGWNEHGNCGREDKLDVTGIHVIREGDTVSASDGFIAAGCGTSWFWR
ncbi:RCC1/BLIP-II protein [Saitoella complicata NRRL Y-17804]|uniref:RCC1-like domain-containing protein n=1 Tax=Saitoella complicata (strain BCRC 22490 / CBS 7301 / JCM 7358 / NBRC 10748 / NRRL Y-17804) TaxID=698492 RepID=A0A0E9NM31_SAICN|nr:RCC1/BLIP-II protein [Saitoella complicata NRRL Y-17804]ODQ53709.1 RCC1/BLIP-II protein [Saitoella complicata NRRL Y-17804]GAO50889.1 hypothetical protein G7K_5008-t1 [Saitoella complicata NRRL Y-17804]